MIDDTLLEAEEKMDKAVEVAREEMSHIRTGRANAGMFSFAVFHKSFQNYIQFGRFLTQVTNNGSP